jgi:hypothetical protein
MTGRGMIIFMMCLGLGAQAQIKIIPREKLEMVNIPQLSPAAKNLKFDVTHIEAEPMGEDDGIKTFVYGFRNVGDEPVTVKRTVTTCSCVVAVCRKDCVQPNDSSEIEVRYNPKGHPGKFDRNVFIYTDDSQMPSAILRLSVDVERGKDLSGLYPVSMGSIRLRRKEMTMDRGVVSIERIPFVNVSGKQLKLECEKAMLPPCLKFSTQPAVIPAGAEGEIVIEYDPSKGGERDKIPVILKGLGVPPTQSSLIIGFEKENK